MGQVRFSSVMSNSNYADRCGWNFTS